MEDKKKKQAVELERFQRKLQKSPSGKSVETEFTRKEEPKRAPAIKEQYADYKVKDPKSKSDGMRWNVRDSAKEQAFREKLQKSPSGKSVETEFTRKEASGPAVKELYADYKVSNPNAKPDGMRWDVAEQPDRAAFYAKLQKTGSDGDVPTEFNELGKALDASTLNWEEITADAMNGSPEAANLLNSVNFAMGGDTPLRISPQGIFMQTPDGGYQPLNVADYADTANKVVSASMGLASYVPGGATKPDSSSGATPQQPTQQGARSQAGTVSATQAIPTRAGRHFDELTPEEQAILHRTMAIDAALQADPTNLNKLLDGPYDRAETEANLAYKKAAAEHYRAKAAAAGQPKPREVEYEYNDEFGTRMIVDKNTKERLYALAPDGQMMPIEFFNNPEGFRQLLEGVADEVGLRNGDKVSWHPKKGPFIITADGKPVTLNDYTTMSTSTSTAQPKRQAIAANLGTAVYGTDH